MKKTHFAPFIPMLILAGCASEPPRKTEGAAAPPVPVATITVRPSSRPSVYEATGTVRARTVAVISAKIMGSVKEVKVQAGDRVRAGQALVSLDARDLDAQLRQAQAALAESRSALPEVHSAIATAKAGLDLAEVTHRRMRDLVEKKSVSNQEFDEASAKLRMARANHEMAVAKESQFAARIRQAEEVVKTAEVMRSYAEIAAPFAGIVTERRVDPGSMATPGAPLLTIEQEGAYRLEAPIDESRALTVRAGQPVRVTVEALARSAEARVSEVVPAVDAASRAFLVKIDLPAWSGLRSGMFARAAFGLGERSLLAVLAGAVREQGQLRSLMVAEDGVARNRLVTVGETVNGETEVLSGLGAGERVIYPLPAALADGARVEVRP